VQVYIFGGHLVAKAQLLREHYGELHPMLQSQRTECHSYSFILSYLFYIPDICCIGIVFLSSFSCTCDTGFWNILIDVNSFAPILSLFILYLTSIVCIHDFKYANFFI